MDALTERVRPAPGLTRRIWRAEFFSRSPRRHTLFHVYSSAPVSDNRPGYDPRRRVCHESSPHRRRPSTVSPKHGRACRAPVGLDAKSGRFRLQRATDCSRADGSAADPSPVGGQSGSVWRQPVGLEAESGRFCRKQATDCSITDGFAVTASVFIGKWKRRAQTADPPRPTPPRFRPAAPFSLPRRHPFEPTAHPPAGPVRAPATAENTAHPHE